MPVNSPRSFVLNRQFSSALGRPELVANNVMGQTYMGPPPVIASNTSQGALARWDSAAASAGVGPTVALMVLIVGVGAFAYWVRPHLA